MFTGKYRAKAVSNLKCNQAKCLKISAIVLFLVSPVKQTKSIFFKIFFS